MKEASQDHGNRYSQVGWQFCLEDSVSFSSLKVHLKIHNSKDVHISKMYIMVHLKALLWNLDDPELLTCFY